MQILEENKTITKLKTCVIKVVFIEEQFLY